MKLPRFLALAVILSLLVACATPPQGLLPLKPESLASPGQRIGVVMTTIPKTDTYLPGAGCLLCIAVASAANSSLTKHANTLGHDELKPLKDEVADLLRQRGAEAVVIADDIDFAVLADPARKEPNKALKNFMSLRSKLNVDRLLVIQVNQIGFLRNYSAYFPTSEPRAVVIGASYIVSLSDNSYDWYMPLHVEKSAEGTWDEAPSFPGLTNAYYQAIELGKDQVREGLKP